MNQMVENGICAGVEIIVNGDEVVFIDSCGLFLCKGYLIGRTKIDWVVADKPLVENQEIRNDGIGITFVSKTAQISLPEEKSS